jgi:hypothetical protein
MSTLDKLAKLNGTDKSSEIHNYCVKYEKYLPFDRYDRLTLLEIGVLNGESLRMWRDYFYRSYIIGIDINPDCKKHEEQKISIEIGSQIDDQFLESVCDKYGWFDLIIDDGSHVNNHVTHSFEKLFPRVKPGGVYVIEDCGTAYWEDYGGGYLKQDSSIEYFKRLSDDVNFRGLMNHNFTNVHARREDVLKGTSETMQPYVRTDIESINFLNGIIIITKR